MNEDIIQSLYADYWFWCEAHGISPERWEDFYNTLNKYSYTPLTRLGFQLRIHALEPIQPNDEQRAVAEVMRMLGGKS